LSIRFHFDPELNILISVAEGMVSFEEVLRHLDREEMEEHLGKPELFDAVAASTNVTPAEVREIVRRLLGLMREHVLGPTSIVTENPVFFGMSRMLSIISELEAGPEFGVFRSPDEGREWLSGRIPDSRPSRVSPT